MRLFLITLAVIAASWFAIICGVFAAVLGRSKNCQTFEPAAVAFVLFELILLIAAPILFWRFSASGSTLARVILTIVVGVLQVVISVIATFSLMVAFNC